MKKIYLETCRWLDSRPQRERTLLLMAILMLIYFIWNTFFFQPLVVRHARVQSRILLSKEQYHLIEQQSKAIKIGAKALDARFKTEATKQQALKEEIKRLDEHLAKFNTRLVPPEQMVGVIQRLMDADPRIKLIAIHNLPYQSVQTETEEGKGKKVAAQLYRHGLKIQFEATFQATMDYLARLEELRLPLSWRNFDYEVIAYPRAKVSMTVDTLSREESWLGV